MGLQLMQEESLLTGYLGVQPLLIKAFMKRPLASQVTVEDASGLLSSRTELPLVCVENQGTGNCLFSVSYFT